MRGRRTAIRILMLAVVCALGLIGASPAQASVERTDRFSILDEGHDFGEGELNGWGRPSADARLEWDLVAGRWEPRLVGRLFLNNANGECIRIQMVAIYQNGVTTTHSDDSSEFCAPNGRTWYNDVDFTPVSSAYVAVVYFRLQSAPAGGWTFSTEAQSLPFLAPWWL
ncbi:hypothetical protein I0C86_02650 [Plantactinospora sp. S1510]|uniref:Secreted protein n=1 Tax=Plantactinospora alkalitolerans TaxID=2789879 RepID=A0ABS0GP00_9ACTN|nr:hypothetical protein [Plantactinospora alkalitolerans]MBF9127903.1 hypothetical protein [Plantactinospora alkalitolerans]